MNIQSISLVVPTEKCENHCPFCVSRMHDNDYSNFLGCPGCDNNLYERDYIERLEYARENGINTIILTGTGESLQNIKIINKFAEWNKNLYRPFHVIELQTTGVFLNDENLKWLREVIGVKTISLSVADIFDDLNNLRVIGVPKKLHFNLTELCKKIKEYGFNLRISVNVLNCWINIISSEINMIYKTYKTYDNDILFKRLHELGTNQVTFRKMWLSGNNSKIDKWITLNTPNDDDFFKSLNGYILEKGKLIGKLTFGALQYSVGNISAVVDQDCMSNEIKDELKYVILREDARLYTRWDDKASLIF